MDFNWNAPLINGLTRNPFFSLESYMKYSISPAPVPLATVKGKNTLKNFKIDGQSGVKQLANVDLSPDHKASSTAVTACLKLKVLFPRPSVFTREEQRLYLELKQKFSDRTQSAVEDMKLLNFLNELHKKVVEEQEEFMKYLEKVAQCSIEDYDFISSVASKFVEEFIAGRRLIVLKYPRFYTMLDTVSLSPPRVNQNICLQHFQTLLEMGTVPRVVLPKVDITHRRYKLFNDKKINPDALLSGKLPIISEDENAERLAVKYGAHVVISSSSLQCLIDNNGPQFQRQWEMPVIIKDHVLSGDAKRRVVYVDKPFIGKNLSNYEKSVLYHRLATKAALIDLANPSSYSLERTADISDKQESEGIEEPDQEAAEKDLFGTSGVDLEALETFGTDSKVRVVDYRNKSLSSSAVVKNPSVGQEPAKPQTSIDPHDCLNDSGDCTDEEDAKLAIDLDSPMSPIMSTDGQFDDEVDGAGSAKRQSQRIAMKRRRTSTVSSSEDASPTLNRSQSRDETLDDGVEGSETLSTGDNVISPSKQSAKDNSDRLSVDNNIDISVQNSLTNEIVSVAEAEGGLLSAVVSSRSTPSLSREDTKLGAGSSEVGSTILPVTLSSVRKRRAGTITQRRLSESGLDLSADPPVTQAPSSAALDVSSQCPPPVSVGTPSISTPSPEINESLSSVDATDRQMHQSVSSGEVNTKTTHVLAKCIAAAEPVEVVKRKRGRPRKDQTISKQPMPARKPAAAELSATPVIRPGVSTTPSTTVSQPPDGEGHSLGRRRVARTPQLSQTPATPLAVSETTSTTIVHAVTTASLSVENTQQTTVNTVNINSSQKLPVPSSKIPISKSSFQSPLDQILVDQSRMFVQSSVNKGNVPTHHLPTNVQFCPSTIAIKSTPSTAVLSTPPVAKVSTSSTALSTSSGIIAQPNRTPSCKNSLQSLSSAAVAPNSTTSTLRHSTTSAVSASVSKTSVADHDKLCSSENPEEYRRPPKGNVVYDLWKLGNLKVLIRHTYHGVYNRPQHQEAYFVHLLSKLEYQLQHGVEHLTYGDAVRSWLALHLRRNVRLIRARIDPLKSEIALFDEWDGIKFQKELPTFHPGPAVTVLNSILEALVRLDPGCHLLSHMPGNAHAQIKKTTKSQSGVYDLHLAYRGSAEPIKYSSTPFLLPWMPINTNHMLPYHVKFGRIPGTFEPKDTALLNTVRDYKNSKNNFDNKKPKKKKKKTSNVS